MLHFYFILSLCVVASCNQDGELLKCKPKPGCSIARCDPRPAGQWFGSDGLDNDYPILCQQNEASSSTTAVTELVNKFDEIRIDLVKIEGRLERSDKVEFDMNSEITLLEKKNAETESGLRDKMDRMKKEVQEEITSLEKTNDEMRNEMDSVKKEAEEDKEKLNGAMKQIAKTDGEMRSEIDSLKKEAEEETGKLNDAMKQITSLEKTNDDMRSEMDSVKKEAEEDKGKLNDAMKQIDLLKKKNAKMEKDAEENKGKTEDLIKRMVSLENENAGKKRENGGMSEKETSPKTRNKIVLCPVIYENKCFIAVIEREVKYDGGVAVCKSRGGHLANIYSQTHMDDVMKYIRENRLGDSGGMWFNLGMKYDPKVKKLTFRDGTDAPAGLKWHHGRPLTVEANAVYAAWTNVILRVNNNQSSISQYLLNYPPSITSYVLCEIE